MKIAPEVRLLKMLGEDLIKDEKTAVIELVKNSYDADATQVKIFFEAFKSDYNFDDKSSIYIVDNGDGMTKSEIQDNWLSPGTANKRKKKILGEKTKLGRVYQGEKGIGRYSMLKLARTVELFTKTKNGKQWNYAKIDLATYDSDYLDTEGDVKLLSDLNIVYDVKPCDNEKIAEQLKDNGTILKLSNLTGNWGSKKVNEIYDDLARLEPLSKAIHGWKSKKDVNYYFKDFSISFYVDGKETNHRKEFYKDLKIFLTLCEKKCLLSVTNGFFDDKTGVFEFYANGVRHTINIGDQEFKKRAYKMYFEEERENFKIEDLMCGPFNFEFYAFNFDNKKNYLKEFVLTPEEKELIEKHRIYLYRDNARVYPYGEAKNDWLSIDALRGIIRANQFLTNGQTVGFVSISHDKNPLLRDKTNREGLIEDGNVTSDFIVLLQSFLQYLRVVTFNNVVGNLKDEDDKRKREEEEKRKKEEEEQRKARAEELRKQEEEEKARVSRLQEEFEKEVNDKNNDLEEKKKALDAKEKELNDKQVELDKKNDELKASAITMGVEKTEFFKESTIIKAPINQSLTIKYNDLINQVTSLSYESHYLIYVMTFRVLIDDVSKRYIAARNLEVKKALGENVRIMIDDLKKLIKVNENTLTRDQKESLKALFGGDDPYRNELDMIKSGFYDNGKQEISATKFNVFAHNPRRIPKDEALHIANNVILPVMVLSQRVMGFIE